MNDNVENVAKILFIIVVCYRAVIAIVSGVDISAYCIAQMFFNILNKLTILFSVALSDSFISITNILFSIIYLFAWWWTSYDQDPRLNWSFTHLKWILDDQFYYLFNGKNTFARVHVMYEQRHSFLFYSLSKSNAIVNLFSTFQYDHIGIHTLWCDSDVQFSFVINPTDRYLLEAYWIC